MKKLGYFTLPTEDGNKTLHFSWNFIDNLQTISGKELTEWGKGMETAKVAEHTKAMTELVFAGMSAHTQEQGQDIDYNIYQVRNWTMDALLQDTVLAKNLTETFSLAMENMMGKKKQGTNLQKAKK